MEKELSVFQPGETYDYVTDLRRAYSESLSVTTTEKIFKTLPDHVFWDIKKPRHLEESHIMNQYNPFRKHPNSSFFDMRDTEEYNTRRVHKNNLNDASSLFKRYWANDEDISH